MVRLRVWATKEEVALISKAARKQGINVNQFLRQTLKKSFAIKKVSAKPRAGKPSRGIGLNS